MRRTLNLAGVGVVVLGVGTACSVTDEGAGSTPRSEGVASQGATMTMRLGDAQGAAPGSSVTPVQVRVEDVKDGGDGGESCATLEVMQGLRVPGRPDVRWIELWYTPGLGSPRFEVDGGATLRFDRDGNLVGVDGTSPY